MPKFKGTSNDPSPSAIKSAPWGRINPTPQSVQTLRIGKGTGATWEETTSYPYRVLSSWHWQRDMQEEELEIEAGPDVVTIRGQGLIRLVDALDSGSLESVREASPPTLATGEDAVVVKSLVIEKSPIA